MEEKKINIDQDMPKIGWQEFTIENNHTVAIVSYTKNDTIYMRLFALKDGEIDYPLTPLVRSISYSEKTQTFTCQDKFVNPWEKCQEVAVTFAVNGHGRVLGNALLNSYGEYVPLQFKINDPELLDVNYRNYMLEKIIYFYYTRYGTVDDNFWRIPITNREGQKVYLIKPLKTNYTAVLKDYPNEEQIIPSVDDCVYDTNRELFLLTDHITIEKSLTPAKIYYYVDFTGTVVSPAWLDVVDGLYMINLDSENAWHNYYSQLEDIASDVNKIITRRYNHHQEIAKKMINKKRG